MNKFLLNVAIFSFQFAVAILMVSFTASAQNNDSKSGNPSILQQGFMAPPDSLRPSVYWYWMSDHISEEGVKNDIEAMEKIGVGRAFIGNIGLSKDEMAYGNVKLFSAEWWKVMRAAISTATKSGIEIGLFNSPGWSQSGGPWIKPSQSMRYLAGDEFPVNGPLKISKKMAAPDPDFQDVVVLAFPAPSGEKEDIAKYRPAITSNAAFDDIKKLMDGNFSTASFIKTPVTKELEVVINFSTSAVFTARSITLYPANKPFRADCELQVNYGGIFYTIKQFEFDRSNPSLNVGFIPYAPVAISLQETYAKNFRLILKDIKGTAGFNEIKLSGAPVVERFAEKQLSKMFPTPLPLWKEYQWPQQAEPDKKSLVIDPGKVINLSKFLSPDGTLNWNAPEGKWIIVRYGMVPTGVTNSPASPEGMGLEIDKINNEAMKHHFDSFVGKIQSSIPLQERGSLKWVVADSYETGSQNWTDGMAAIFTKKYGYDPLPWLPVLGGRVVATAEQSNRFLWDLRRLIADRVAYQYVGGLRDISHKNGLKIWLENYGHWGFPSEFLLYGGQSDEIGGEFWNEGTLGDIECRAASSAAHIYGKTKVAAESFTAGGRPYERYPALLKKRGDWAFTEGVNNTLLHVFISQPYEEKNPGINAWFGTEFNRKNTWFYQGKAFVDYIRRCNFMLQQGKPVNDVAYFIGEDAPKMTGTRDPELPHGFSYDYINAEVLLERASVKDGRLVLSDGMSYRLLVLPQLETMRPQLLRKIGTMVKEGLTVLGPSPKRSPSLQNYPSADAEVQKLVLDIWGKLDGVNNTTGTYGKGNLLYGASMQEALNLLHLVPDVSLPDKNVLYAHRTTKEAEIYFLTNQTDRVITIVPAFRVTKKTPEWWDAVTGATRRLTAFTPQGEVTTVPIKLEPYQSGFVIFKNNADVNTLAGSGTNFPEAKLITAINTPWTVKFDKSARGPSKTLKLKELIDWSTSNDPALQNYSGTAFYQTNISIGALPENKSVFLNLGMVKAMAKVKVNGKEVGSVWTPPYSVDVTNVIKTGKNKIEIEVVNTWVNRMIGDSKLPAAERKTWSNVNPFTPESKYDPSGLLGPVRLEAFEY